MKLCLLSTPSPTDVFFVYKDGYHDDIVARFINQTYSFFLFSLKAPSTPKGKITFFVYLLILRCLDTDIHFCISMYPVLRETHTQFWERHKNICLSATPVYIVHVILWLSIRRSYVELPVRTSRIFPNMPRYSLVKFYLFLETLEQSCWIK